MLNQQFTLKGDTQTNDIWMNGKKLSPSKSQKVNNHSPDGFNWGYAGSGPAQLALAILLEIWPQPKAMDWYQKFKTMVVAELPPHSFEVRVTISGTNFYMSESL